MGFADSMKQVRQRLADKLAAKRESLEQPDSSAAPAAQPQKHRIGLTESDVASAGFPEELRSSDSPDD